MDIRLRGTLDGIEAAATIRERFDIPVVFLTAHSEDATVARAKRTGPLGYLIKPFAERDLRVTIEIALHRQELERRLKESEERYATTLTCIGDAVIATDAEGRITFMNPVAETMTRWRQEEALGLPLGSVFNIIDAVTGAIPEGPVAKALREGGVVTLDDQTVLVTKDEAEIPIDDTAAPIRDAKGQVRGAVLVFRDISERKQAEAALHKAEEQLRQSQKMEAIGRLAGGVAHDINNMMTVVIGYGEILLGQLPPDSPLRENVQVMKEAGDRAAMITRQLLAFSRKQVLMPVVANLNEIVSNMERVLRRVIGEDIEVACHLEPKLGCAKVDLNQMDQVIMNLAINARDAMVQGGKLIMETRNVILDESHAQETPELQPGRYVMLAVTDTGCGMDEYTKSRLFEPFFTTKELGKGTGLGLATVYGIVKQSGGYIYAFSEPGHGTTFKVYLPQVSDPASPRPSLEPVESTDGTETVLLVEDDDSVRAVTRSILQRSGYVVLEAADGAEAIQLCAKESRPIHILLTDAIMPNISGRVLAQRVTQCRPGIKVLFMSGHADDQILGHGALTAEKTIQKPFTPAELTRRVRQALDEGACSSAS
jgi:PAS domain S-box-containing protein